MSHYKARYHFLVGFFVDRRGKKPVEEYICDGKNITDLSVIINVIQRLAIAGLILLDTEMVKTINEPVYELRKGRHRIMFAPDGKRFVLLSAFTKQTQKTPPAEIERAIKHYNEYLETGGWFELRLPAV